VNKLQKESNMVVGCAKMKLNISFPVTGCQKLIEVDDERKLRTFYEKRMATEVAANALGGGCVIRISGGNDKQGFTMKQDILTHGRRKLKSVRGCIEDGNLSVLNLVIFKKGEKDIPGLIDTTVPRRLGPKRASRIRKLFNLSKEDDVRQYVKTKEEAAEYAKLLTKRMKEAKEKCQEQIAKRRRLSSLRASTSKSQF
ncbi:LOW QUALITY PROTEIN: hypothetical protein U0070_009999, partial [Myodes glareolus]